MREFLLKHSSTLMECWQEGRTKGQTIGGVDANERGIEGTVETGLC